MKESYKSYPWYLEDADYEDGPYIEHHNKKLIKRIKSDT